MTEQNVRLDQAYQLSRNRQYMAALDIFTSCINHDPVSERAWMGAGACLYGLLQKGEAIKCFEFVLSKNPNHAAALIALAGFYSESGDLTLAKTYAERAVALDGNNLDYCRIFSQIQVGLATDPLEIKAIFARYANQFYNGREVSGNHLYANRFKNGNLKIAYVSGDLRSHSVAYFMEPVFAHHHYETYDIFVYATLGEDEVSNRIKSNPLTWLNVSTFTDEQLRNQILKDEIDILIDLSGHTAGNRLKVFAQRAAPVQVTWLGFMHTLGMKTIDYRLTDAGATPAGTDFHFVERLYRLPCMATYEPPFVVDTPKQAPHHAKGHVTVACLNHSRKLSDDALRLFDSIAGSHEKVKFLLISNEKSQQNAELSFRQRAESLKINFEHFEIRAFMPLKAFMSLGAEVDFVVDSFPTSGGTTTLHSLWMGLPIVALQSTISANNTTANMLAGLGLHSLIAHDPSEYKDIVCHLINEPDQLDGLRLEVRRRLQSSPLMNYEERVRDLELFFEFAKEEWQTKNVHAGV